MRYLDKFGPRGDGSAVPRFVTHYTAVSGIKVVPLGTNVYSILVFGDFIYEAKRKIIIYTISYTCNYIISKFYALNNKHQIFFWNISNLSRLHPGRAFTSGVCPPAANPVNIKFAINYLAEYAQLEDLQIKKPWALTDV